MSQTTTPADATEVDVLAALDCFINARFQVCCGNTQGGGHDENGDGEPPQCCGQPLESDELGPVRTAVAELLTREAALVAERDELALAQKTAHRLLVEAESDRTALTAERNAARACLQMIYKELQHIAPWSESNDMETVDEIMCGLGLLAQDRDALAAEVGALRSMWQQEEQDVTELRKDAVRFTHIIEHNWIGTATRCKYKIGDSCISSARIAIDAARAEAGHG